LTFLAILLGTLAAGIGSVWLAALLSFGALARYTQHMLSMAAGALMATAFMHLLPEAFESGIEPHDLFLTLLVGLVFFFCWTRRSSGITAMSTTTDRRRKVVTQATTTRVINITAIPITAMVRTPVRRVGAAVGPCWPAIACIVLVTAC